MTTTDYITKWKDERNSGVPEHLTCYGTWDMHHAIDASKMGHDSAEWQDYRDRLGKSVNQTMRHLSIMKALHEGRYVREYAEHGDYES